MKYVANNLEDVANFFEAKANAEKKIGGKPSEKKVHEARAITWLMAADFIRNCEIKAE